MFRVGILGTENSHAMAFAKYYHEQAGDIQITAVGGIDREASRKVADVCGAAIIDSPDEMVKVVDAVMVTARDGRYHAAFARPFIEAGKPAFIDKPFTSDPAEAEALAALAKSKGVPLVGGSSVKLTDAARKLKAIADEGNVMGGDVTAPVSLVNDYGDFWFYASHLVEVCLTVFGQNPEWVWANRTKKGVTVIMHYPAFDVTHHFVEGVYDYTGTVITQQGVRFEVISLDDIYERECADFTEMLHTGNMPHSYEELVKPVSVMAAIEQSFTTGQKVPV